MTPPYQNSSLVAVQLAQAIRANKRPQLLFVEFLSGGSKEANFLANKMYENKEVLKVICSQQGRAWLHIWLNDFLDYLQQFSV